MNLGLKGKKTLVTGAGRGIGRSIATCLKNEGADVIVASRTQLDNVDYVMDLMEEGAPGELVTTLRKRNISPDIVVHNLGGTLGITDPFCSIEDWRKVWRLNMEVALELNNLLIPDMRDRHWGRIVHISSISALVNHGPVTYCSIKAALTAYSRCMGRFLAPEGIVVTAVLPGATMTEGGYWDIASTERPDHVEKFLADRMAIHRFAHPDEIGNVVAFLCSEQASFMIGSSVPVDGGQGRNY